MVAAFSVSSSELASRAGGGVNLDFDASLFVQVGFIIVLWLVLKPVLFDPMLKLFEEREKRTEGAKLKARHIDEKSAEAKAEYDELMTKARGEGATEREKLRAESLKKESELLTSVRSDAQKKLDDARAQIQKEADGTRGDLAPRAEALAKSFATRVLGREVS